MSTTSSFNVAKHFSNDPIDGIGTLMIIFIPQNFKLIYISDYNFYEEEEYVIRPYTKFRVVKPSTNFIYLIPICDSENAIKSNFNLSQSFKIIENYIKIFIYKHNIMNVIKAVDFKGDNIKFKCTNNKKTKIFYKSNSTTKKLYLSCSGVVLGNSIKQLSTSYDSSDDISNNEIEKYFIDINLNKQENIDVIEHIDYKAILQLMLYTHYSLTEIESMFIPTIKFSALNRSLKSLKIGCDKSSLSVYDQDGNLIPISFLENNSKCSVLLSVENIIYDFNETSGKPGRYYLDWNIVQLRTNTKLPLDYFPQIKECKIPESDIISTDDEEI